MLLICFLSLPNCTHFYFLQIINLFLYITFLGIFGSLHTAKMKLFINKNYTVTKLKFIEMHITINRSHYCHIRQQWNLLPVWGCVSIGSTKSGLQEQPVSKNLHEVSSREVNQVWDIQSTIHKEGRKFNRFRPSEINC